MIRAQNLSKYFGAKRALGPVSFEIEDGESVGFLGLNGAGKTTALRIFACDLRPSSGNVAIGDIDALADPHEVRKRIGFLPEHPPLYGDMVVEDYLLFAGKLRGMSPSQVQSRMPEVLAVTHLDGATDEPISTLSHGFRQRVGVAQAIVHNPSLLILDEPTRGLDPVQIVEMRKMINDLKKAHTVLISSHILTEISETCDRLLVLGDGKIIASGTEDMLSKDMLKVSRVAITARAKSGSDADALAAVIKKVSGVSECELVGSEGSARSFDIGTDRDIRAELCRALVEAGHEVIRLDRAQRELENLFLKLVAGGSDARN